MKLSIYLPTLIVLAIASTASAQSTSRGTIVDSIAIPTLPGSSAPTISSAPIITSPSPAQSYVGDLAPSSEIISGSSAGISDSSIVSGGSTDAGDVVDLGVISEDQEGSIGALSGVGGGCRERTYGRPDLFYNYYTQGNCNRANAQMYVSPVPVPAHVGHTFYTYQPFYPEEYLYWHKNTFHNYYDNGRGLNRTRATYYSPPVRQAISNLYWNKIRLPR